MSEERADDQRAAEVMPAEGDERILELTDMSYEHAAATAAEFDRLRAELAETRDRRDYLQGQLDIIYDAEYSRNDALKRRIEKMGAAGDALADQAVDAAGRLSARGEDDMSDATLTQVHAWRSVRGDAPTQPPAPMPYAWGGGDGGRYFPTVEAPAVTHTDGQPPTEPGTILHAWQQIARLVGREDTSPASVVDRVAYLAETAPAPADEGGGLYEQLAAIQHDIWAHWMRYLLGRKSEPVLSEPTGRLLRAADIEHWRRQIDTPYAELTEKEKASDREQVDRFWPLLTTTADDEADGLTAEQYRHIYVDLIRGLAVDLGLDPEKAGGGSVTAAVRRLVAGVSVPQKSTESPAGDTAAPDPVVGYVLARLDLSAADTATLTLWDDDVRASRSEVQIAHAEHVDDPPEAGWRCYELRDVCTPPAGGSAPASTDGDQR